MADFGMYQLISKNKRNSYLLLFLMLILISAICTIFGGIYGGKEYIIISFITGLLVAGMSGLFGYFIGAPAIMAMSGAREVKPEQEPQLYNIVEEVCIAAGLPRPGVYVIESDCPNAFATGRNPEHAAIAVTRGLMNTLNRNELQGVIAHEISHVGNYDILFGTLMSIFVGTAIILSDIMFRSILWSGGGRSSRSSRSSGNAKMILLLIAILLKILTPILAIIIQLASSRQREYLADATAAKITRNPGALADALRKISGYQGQYEYASSGTQQLYIINPFKEKRTIEKESIFSTHPPIKLRIECLKKLELGM